MFSTTPRIPGVDLPVPGDAPPQARHRRGPHPVRQDHRLRPTTLAPDRPQRRLARTQPRGDRPAGLDSSLAAGRELATAEPKKFPYRHCCAAPPSSHAAAGACACGSPRHGSLKRRAGHGLPSPRRAARPSAGWQKPHHPQPQGPWRTQPPRRVSVRSEHRTHNGQRAVSTLPRLIAKTRTARLTLRFLASIPEPTTRVRARDGRAGTQASYRIGGPGRKPAARSTFGSDQGEVTNLIKRVEVKGW